MRFLFGKVPLLRMFDKYTSQRQEREDEKRKYLEKKRLQQLAVEKEAMHCSRPAVKKPLGPSANNANNLPGTPIAVARRGGGTPGTGRYLFSSGKDRRESGKVNTGIPVN